MPSNRKIVLANGEYYHVFNRGVEKRPVFTSKNEFLRALDLLRFYRFDTPPVRYSKYLSLENERRQEVLDSLDQKAVDILAYCLMDNHFHFLVRQASDNGIAKFMANFTNAYTKYFNTKHQRVGPLFQGPFKSVHIADDEQLLHVSRYIHLNPVLGYKIKAEELEHYTWSSYPDYVKNSEEEVIEKNEILNFFAKQKKQKDYAQFVLDQVDYAKSLKAIDHLRID